MDLISIPKVLWRRAIDKARVAGEAKVNRLPYISDRHR
jgi:hypothetical protein